MGKQRYNYRAYPTPQQTHALNQLYGTTRWTYNQYLEHAEKSYANGEKYNTAELARQVTTQAKQDHPWLTEVASVALQQAARQADQAYRNWFNSLKGKRKGKTGHPQFKSKHRSRPSATLTKAIHKDGIVVHRLNRTWGDTYIPKVGWLRFRMSRDLPSEASSLTIYQEPDGSTILSFVVEVPDREPVAIERVAGIDLGLTHFATVVYSDGTREKVDNPRYLRKAERRLRLAQKNLSRKQKGSANRERARVRVARAYAGVRHQRADFTHQLSARIARENQAVGVESLSIEGLKRTRLGKSVSDAGWGLFLNQLGYKTRTVAIDRFEPSTRRCSQCKNKGGLKPLSVREWVCSSCGAVLDRDWNAAVNILVAAGLAETVNACGVDVRLGLALAVDSEARTSMLAFT